MFHTLKEFLNTWKYESASTISLFEKLTDESLDNKVYAEGRTLARLANHIIESLSELPGKLKLGIEEEHPDHHSASALVKNYKEASEKLVEAINANWTDASLEEKNNLYGEEWKNTFSLWVLVLHQVHHRGQMTVLMRQAGIKIPGLYGPAKEEWEAMGMKALD
jgi:uncharacterized damage-inducible protein DinB